MKADRVRKKNPFRGKMALRLWLMMMLLVALGIVFMWVVQILLLERNYVDSALLDVQNRLEPIMENLKTEDLAQNDKLLPYLSKSVSGKMMLVSDSGELLSMYSNGYLLDSDYGEAHNSTWHYIKSGPQYEQVLQREEYKIVHYDHKVPSFELGIPVHYDGQDAYAILYHSLDEVYTVLRINRRQLVILSVILSGMAAALSALLSRRFIKPIFKIKGAVDGLAAGELDARPDVKLQDELGRLSESVEELGVALKRVDILRKEVIANVSHELRAPLALIAGYAEMLRDLHWRDDEKRRQDLNLIISEAGRMSEMVSDIMDYSQLQAGYVKLNKARYNLYEIIESELQHCKQSAREHDISIHLNSFSADIPADLDALKISQVMRNLLYNAVNHTEDGKSITVSIEKGSEGLRVSVANQGAPIPEEDREIIWERYQRSQHQGARKKGTGIGLSIVKTILEAHGMDYGVDCREGLTVFWFVYGEG